MTSDWSNFGYAWRVLASAFSTEDREERFYLQNMTNVFEANSVNSLYLLESATVRTTRGTPSGSASYRWFE